VFIGELVNGNTIVHSSVGLERGLHPRFGTFEENILNVTPTRESIRIAISLVE